MADIILPLQPVAICWDIGDRSGSEHRFPKCLPCCSAGEVKINVFLFSAGNLFRWSLTMLTQLPIMYSKSFAIQVYDEAEQRTYRCHLSAFSICFKPKALVCSEADAQPWACSVRRGAGLKILPSSSPRTEKQRAHGKWQSRQAL